MADNNIKNNKVSRPVERHITAAWAGVEQQKPDSCVPIPPMDGVIEAKDYVDTNQK